MEGRVEINAACLIEEVDELISDRDLVVMFGHTNVPAGPLGVVFWREVDNLGTGHVGLQLYRLIYPYVGFKHGIPFPFLFDSSVNAKIEFKLSDHH